MLSGVYMSGVGTRRKFKCKCTVFFKDCLGIVSKISLEIAFWLIDYRHGWVLIGCSGITFIIFSRQSVFRGRFSDQRITMFYGFFLTNQYANLSDILETIPKVDQNGR